MGGLLKLQPAASNAALVSVLVVEVVNRETEVNMPHGNPLGQTRLDITPLPARVLTVTVFCFILESVLNRASKNRSLSSLYNCTGLCTIGTLIKNDRTDLRTGTEA